MNNCLRCKQVNNLITKAYIFPAYTFRSLLIHVPVQGKKGGSSARKVPSLMDVVTEVIFFLSWNVYNYALCVGLSSRLL